MTPPPIPPSHIRRALLLREEIALLDVRHEAAFATGHPLFAANMAAGRIELEAETRLPSKDVPIVVYDAGEALFPRLRIALWHWGIRMFASSRGDFRPGRARALSCSVM